ncbi:MAG: STAS domain-containing protein [Myxococcaceae bacterium]|nr:STAS domain-containing protein [Myxococcaceae bacterium]MCI0671956.1 STAS domain-containing protein [Myxococcaceae bacterium]
MEQWSERQVEQVWDRDERGASGHVLTLLLEGELGVKELAEVGDELFRLLQRGVTQVVLDFTEVPHLDYRGVRPLLPRVEALRRAGGDVKLSGLSSYLAAVLRASGAHGVFEVYPHCNDARAAFSVVPTDPI